MKPDFYQGLQSLYLGDIYYFSIEMAPVLAENLDLKKPRFRNLFNQWPSCQETTVSQHDFNIAYFARQTAGWGRNFSHFLINPWEAKIRLLCHRFLVSVSIESVLTEREATKCFLNYYLHHIKMLPVFQVPATVCKAELTRGWSYDVRGKVTHSSI